jgi:hypothetical protein
MKFLIIYLLGWFKAKATKTKALGLTKKKFTYVKKLQKNKILFFRFIISREIIKKH